MQPCSISTGSDARPMVDNTRRLHASRSLPPVGLSHFVVDEELDRRVLAAIEDSDGDTLCSL